MWMCFAGPNRSQGRERRRQCWGYEHTYGTVGARSVVGGSGRERERDTRSRGEKKRNERENLLCPATYARALLRFVSLERVQRQQKKPPLGTGPEERRRTYEVYEVQRKSGHVPLFRPLSLSSSLLSLSFTLSLVSPHSPPPFPLPF